MQPVATEVVIRPCETLTELEACLDLQRQVWGYADADLAPVPILIVARKTGGHVLGAFDAVDEDRLVGFTLAFAGIRAGTPYVHSHYLGVLRAYRNRGVGRALKLAQREHCLREGIKLMEWTFDPLEIKNARLNMVHLGAIARKFVPNLYGVTSSRLHGNLPTDRLVVQWHLDCARVKAALAGNRPRPAADAVRITLPTNVGQIREEDPEAVRNIQSQLRRAFEDNFARGLAATGLEVGEGSASYLLEPYED